MKRLVFIVLSVFFIGFISCERTPESPQIAPVVRNADYSGITIDFTPSAGVASIEYALCPIQDAGKQALSDFDSGSLEGIASHNPADGSLTIPVDSIGPYMLYARGISQSGAKSQTASLSVTGAPSGLYVKSFNSIIMETMPYTFDENCASVGGLVASKSVIAEVGMTIEEILEVYYISGEIKMDAMTGEPLVLALNGEPEYEYYVGIVSADAQGNLISKDAFTFFAPPFDSSYLEPGKITIEVTNITSNSAQVVCRMGANTCAYYQAVMPKADYDELLETAASLEIEPETYVRDYIAVFGTFMTEDDDHVWPDLPSATEMVVLCYPMNGNGIQGYGEGSIYEFTTL